MKLKKQSEAHVFIKQCDFNNNDSKSMNSQGIQMPKSSQEFYRSLSS